MFNAAFGEIADMIQKMRIFYLGIQHGPVPGADRPERQASLSSWTPFEDSLPAQGRRG
jgi:hypothetical protein